MSEHIKKEHNKTLLLFHLVCPVRYRRKAFTEAVTQSLREICSEIEKRYEIYFVEIGTDEDHVHFLIQTVPVMMSRFVQVTKSITARELFIRQPEVKRLLWGGKFWTSGYYLNTVGYFGNEKVIKEYVQNQGKTYKQAYRGQIKLFEDLP
ncbi:MAG: IS200/IS605 family transposase [Rhabdochlamydiaceae bacterium]